MNALVDPNLNPASLVDADPVRARIDEIMKQAQTSAPPEPDLLTVLQAQLSTMRDPISDSKGQGDIAFRKDVRAHVIKAQLVVLNHVNEHVREATEIILQSLSEVQADFEAMREAGETLIEAYKQDNFALRNRIKVLESRWYERLSFYLWEFLTMVFGSLFGPRKVECDLCGRYFPRGDPDGHGYGECVDVPAKMLKEWDRAKGEDRQVVALSDEATGKTTTIECQFCSDLLKVSMEDKDHTAFEGIVGEEILDQLQATGHFPQCPSFQIEQEERDQAEGLTREPTTAGGL